MPGIAFTMNQSSLVEIFSIYCLLPTTSPNVSVKLFSSSGEGWVGGGGGGGGGCQLYCVEQFMSRCSYTGLHSLNICTCQISQSGI